MHARHDIAAFCVGPVRFSRSSRDPSATPPSIRRPTARRRRQTTRQTGELIRGNAATIASPHVQAVDVSEADCGIVVRAEVGRTEAHKACQRSPYAFPEL